MYIYRTSAKDKANNAKATSKDSVFKELPIVRKNMQGINGVELYPSTYNHLLDMAKSDLARLEYVVDEADDIYAREKTLRINLLSPSLKN